MFAWIHAKKSKHPLADATDAREFLEQLASTDDNGALQKLSEYLDGVKTCEGLNIWHASEIIDAVERAGRPRYANAIRGLVYSGPEVTRFQANRIVAIVGEYLVQLAEAYEFCLAVYESGVPGASALRSKLTRTIGRAIRVRGAALRLDYVRYTSQFGTWTELYRLYQLAEVRGHADEKVLLYSGEPLSTISREFGAALMLETCSPQGLRPEQLDIAYRVVCHLADQFVISADRKARLPFFFDPASSAPPRRIHSGVDPSRAARRLGLGAAEAKLKELASQAERKALIAAELNLDGAPEEMVRATLRHLVRHWCGTPPERKHARKQSAMRITVVHGFEEVAANVGGRLLKYPFVSDEETWLLVNAGTGGVGAIVATPRGEWVRVGSLLAYRHGDERTWAGGIVRHLRKEDDSSRYVGIEVVFERAVAVSLACSSCPVQGGKERGIGLWLPSQDQATDDIRLLLPAALYLTSKNLSMGVYDQRYELECARLVEAGGDFHIAIYKRLKQETIQGLPVTESSGQ